MFFFYFNPSQLSLFLIPIPPLSPFSGPYPKLSSHPPLPPQSLPSSPFCASWFSFPSPSPGLSSSFPVRYVCLPKTPRPLFPPHLLTTGAANMANFQCCVQGCKCMRLFHSPLVRFHLNCFKFRSQFCYVHPFLLFLFYLTLFSSHCHSRTIVFQVIK